MRFCDGCYHDNKMQKPGRELVGGELVIERDAFCSAYQRYTLGGKPHFACRRRKEIIPVEVK